MTWWIWGERGMVLLDQVMGDSWLCPGFRTVSSDSKDTNRKNLAKERTQTFNSWQKNISWEERKEERKEGRKGGRGGRKKKRKRVGSMVDGFREAKGRNVSGQRHLSATPNALQRSSKRRSKKPQGAKWPGGEGWPEKGKTIVSAGWGVYRWWEKGKHGKGIIQGRRRDPHWKGIRHQEGKKDFKKERKAWISESHEKNPVECERVSIKWRKRIIYIENIHQRAEHRWKACS